MRGRVLFSLAVMGLLAWVGAAPASAQSHHDDYDHGARAQHHRSRTHDSHRRSSLGHTVTDVLRYGTTNSHSSRSHYYRDHYDDRGYGASRSYRRDGGRTRSYSRDRYYEPYGYSRDRYDSYGRCD